MMEDRKWVTPGDAQWDHSRDQTRVGMVIGK